MASQCPDFGMYYKKPMIDNLYAHMEVAWEVNCVDELLSCAYRAAGTKKLDHGSFKFLPETFASVFHGAAPAHELADFQKKLTAGLKLQWAGHFGHSVATSKWSPKHGCTAASFHRARAAHKKALAQAWTNHFKGYGTTPAAVWKKLKKQHFNPMMQALCDKLGGDSNGHHMDALVKFLKGGSQHDSAQAGHAQHGHKHGHAHHAHEHGDAHHAHKHGHARHAH
jgi:hypothetical protein